MIKSQAASLGFDACGFAAAVPVDDEATARYDRWIEQGHNGCMQWAAGHRDLRRDPSLLLEGANTVISLALPSIANYGMWMRRYMVDESTKDYVQLARIKGCNGSRIMFRHIFRNAFVPMAQYLPTSFLNTVIGSIYIESLWSIKGMGGLLVDVIHKQDNNMILGIVLLFACVGIIGLILGDVLMVLFDPRISFTKKGGDGA